MIRFIAQTVVSFSALLAGVLGSIQAPPEYKWVAMLAMSGILCLVWLIYTLEEKK